MSYYIIDNAKISDMYYYTYQYMNKLNNKK